MSRRLSRPGLACDHQQTGYCVECWRAALARGLSAAEWEDLHIQAANGNVGFRPRVLPALRGCSPAKSWNGSAVGEIRAAIEASTEAKWRARCLGWTGQGGHGYRVVATDGSRLLATPEAPDTEIAAVANLLDPARLAWMDLPAGVDVVIRRVLQIYDPGRKRTKYVKCQLEGEDLILEATNSREEYARERIPVRAAGADVAVTLNAEWLLQVLRGPIRLGVEATYAMLEPAAREWRYVQMGATL